MEFKRGLKSDEVGSGVLWVNSDPPQSTGSYSSPVEGRAQVSPRCVWKDVMGVIEIPRYARNDVNGESLKKEKSLGLPKGSTWRKENRR